MSGSTRRIGTSIIGMLALAGGLLVGFGALATPAEAAAIVIGQTGSNGDVCSNGASLVQVGTAAGVPSYVVPPGLTEITGWSTRAGADEGSMALEVWRKSATPDSFALVGISPVESLTANTLNQFILSSPIQVSTGDLLGMFVLGGNCLVTDHGPAGNAVDINNTPTPPTSGNTVTFENVGLPYELNISAMGPTPPSLSKAFTSSSIPVNGTTTLIFTLTNPNPAAALTGVGFSDALPAGLTVANPSQARTTCQDPRFRPNPAPGSSTITVGRGSLNPAEICTATVTVQATNMGIVTNTTSAVTSDQGSGNAASASLTLVGPPVVSKSFGASPIHLGASTSLRFTLTNPNTTTALTGVGFSDTLPDGLVVDTPNNGLTGSCGGGTIAAGSGSRGISLAGATIAASGSCTFSVNVIGIKPGKQDNTTGPPASNEGGQGEPAKASVAVDDCPGVQHGRILQASTNVGTILGAFCVDSTGAGTYTQGTVAGTGQVNQHGATTVIVANGNNLELTGVREKDTNQFTETLPVSATGSFEIKPTLTAIKQR